jgi:hypothetical protein
MRQTRIASYALAVASLALGPGVSAVVIDDFSTAQSVVAPLVAPFSQVSGPGILGGERDAYLGLTSGSSISASIENHALWYLEEDNSDGYLYLTWDGPDDAPEVDHDGLDGADLTEGGTQNALKVEILFNSQTATLGFVAYSALGSSIVYFDAPSGASTQVVPFSDFEVLGGGGADFANLGSLIFLSEPGAPGQTMQLGVLETLPEPSGASGLAVGAAGIALARARRRAAPGK